MFQGLKAFAKVEPITKGWSEDKKYYVETNDGKRMLLRISDISAHDSKEDEFNTMRRLYTLGIVPQPIEFGLCDGGKSCYSLSGWVDGEDAENMLPLMPKTEQYVLGLRAGKTLRKIHNIPAPDDISDWENRYFAVIDKRIEAYHSEGLPFEGSEIILEYLEYNRTLLHDRPQCLLHGDFHEGNLMLNKHKEIYVIDPLDEGFGNYGDPWYDFKAFGENNNAYFSTGFVRGYFDAEPPQIFWDVLTYYIVTAALTSIVWMKYHKSDKISEALEWNEKNARCLKKGQSPLLGWYLKNFYIQWIDSVPYKLKAPYDFSFISNYGKVFKVFDDQDSGNICFGVMDGQNKYFIKYAGAPTDRACVSAEEAVINLKHTMPVYSDLAHPNLIKFIKAEEVGGGFAMIFEWVDAECMHPMHPLSCMKFMQMPIETRIRVFNEILAFHAYVAKKRYVAIDFYDGSIMYDFNRNKTIICDIDFYTKTPYTNNKGRMWGSSRFMSPEEFQLGAPIDEVTNVYTMGATAFALFGDERDRRFEKWMLNKELFTIAKRAVSDDRSRRQQTIEQFFSEWGAAL